MFNVRRVAFFTFLKRDTIFIMTTSLLIYKPNLEDMWFRKQMLEDEETMSYNHAWGGAIPFPKQDWKDWYDAWLGEKAPKDRYYRYLKNKDDDFVGEIALHYDNEYQGYVVNVIIFSKFRRRGYGKEALDILCQTAKEKGITFLYDDIAIDNPATALFLKCGFKEQYRTNDIILLKKDLF